MKFLVTWKVPEENWINILDVFSSLSPDERADAGEGVTIEGRWHDLADKSGVASWSRTTSKRFFLISGVGIRTWK